MVVKRNAAARTAGRIAPDGATGSKQTLACSSSSSRFRLRRTRSWVPRPSAKRPSWPRPSACRSASSSARMTRLSSGSSKSTLRSSTARGVAISCSSHSGRVRKRDSGSLL